MAVKERDCQENASALPGYGEGDARNGGDPPPRDDSSVMADDIPEIEADDASEAVLDGAFLLDVREPDEWSAGHAPEAVHVPMGELVLRVAELPRDRRIVAICRSGQRSRVVAEALAAEGYDVVNTVGGMRAWQAYGFDVVDDSGGPGVVI